MGNAQGREPVLYTRARLLQELGKDKNSFIGAALSNDVLNYVLLPYVLPPTLLVFHPHEYVIIDLETLTIAQTYRHLRAPDGRFVVPTWTGALDCWSLQTPPSKISAFRPLQPVENLQLLNSLSCAGAVATPRRSYVFGGSYSGGPSSNMTRTMYAVDEESGVVPIRTEAPFAAIKARIVSLGEDQLVITSTVFDVYIGQRTTHLFSALLSYDLAADRFAQLPLPKKDFPTTLRCTNWGHQLLLMESKYGRSDVRMSPWLHDARARAWVPLTGEYPLFERMTRCVNENFIWAHEGRRVVEYDLRNAAPVRKMDLSDRHALAEAFVYCEPPSSL